MEAARNFLTTTACPAEATPPFCMSQVSTMTLMTAADTDKSSGTHDCTAVYPCMLSSSLIIMNAVASPGQPVRGTVVTRIALQTF